jgi:hypothetical protein
MGTAIRGWVSARALGLPGLALLLTLPDLSGCDAAARVRDVLERRAVLRRQIEDLERLLKAAEGGAVLPKDKLMVAVSERIANDFARLALPREEVLAGRYRVRLEKADVRFREEHGSVRLDGRVGEARGPEPEWYAELALFGVVDTVGLDRATAVLHCNVALTRFELERLGAPGESESDAGRQLLEELGRQGVEALRPLAFPIAIPVRLETEISLPGTGEKGPVRLEPRSVPLRLTVSGVSAHGGRLWVALDVATGPDRGRPRESSPSGEGER